MIPGHESNDPCQVKGDHAQKLAPSGNRIQGVLFDATGTLFETRESIGTVYARRAVPHGVDLPAWRLDRAFAQILASAPPRVFPDCDELETEDREQAWWRAVVRSSFLAADRAVVFDDYASFFSEIYRYYQTADAWVLRPGTRDLLRELKQRDFRTGIVSNFDQRLAIILQALEIAEFLDVLMIPARCRAEKPDARIFEAALQSLELPASAVVYVGDDPEKDRAAGARVGMQCFDPDAFEAFADLIDHIDEMNSRSDDVAGRALDSSADDPR